MFWNVGISFSFRPGRSIYISFSQWYDHVCKNTVKVPSQVLRLYVKHDKVPSRVDFLFTTNASRLSAHWCPTTYSWCPLPFYFYPCPSNILSPPLPTHKSQLCLHLRTYDISLKSSVFPRDVVHFSLTAAAAGTSVSVLPKTQG